MKFVQIDVENAVTVIGNIYENPEPLKEEPTC